MLNSTLSLCNDVLVQIAKHIADQGHDAAFFILSNLIYKGNDDFSRRAQRIKRPAVIQASRSGAYLPLTVPFMCATMASVIIDFGDRSPPVVVTDPNTKYVQHSYRPLSARTVRIYPLHHKHCRPRKDCGNGTATKTLLHGHDEKMATYIAHKTSDQDVVYLDHLGLDPLCPWVKEGNYFYTGFDKLLSLGTLGIHSLRGFYIYNHDNTIFAQPLDTSRVTDMSYMFHKASCFGRLRRLYTAHVTTMAHMFDGCYRENPNVTRFNTSNVQDMSYMFSWCKRFCQPIGHWDTRRVTTMEGMFFRAKSFNADISNWNVANVTNMAHMFAKANTFNQPIGQWDTSQVTSMVSMFFLCKTFNQPIGAWNTSSVVSMRSMFHSCRAFNQPIDSWNTSAVEDMSFMFLGTMCFNQPLASWDVTRVQTMIMLFAETKEFMQDLSTWNIPANTDVYRMFYNSKISRSGHIPLRLTFDQFMRYTDVHSTQTTKIAT